MKPVFQTLYGKPNGNCFQACVASLLEVTLDDLPHFCRDFGTNWMAETNRWLNDHYGVCLLSAPYDELTKWWVGMQGAWCILNGKNPLGIQHSVVGQVRCDEAGWQDLVVVHNPNDNPDRHIVKVASVDFLILARGPKAERRVKAAEGER